MSHREQPGGSPASPVMIPGSPEDHENLQQTNVQPSLDSPAAQETYEAILEAERRKEEIKMIPTPISWKIIKTLTKSDLSTLRLSVNPVAEHVLRHLSVVPTNRSEIILDVDDYDTDSTHKLSLGYGKDGYDRFGGFWKSNFVLRRGLKEGNEIGLAWNPSTSTFVFGVISAAGSTHCPVDKFINPHQSLSPTK